MAIYDVHAVGWIDTGFEVEADSLDEAEELAFESDKLYVSLCHQCAREWNPGEANVASIVNRNDETETREFPDPEARAADALREWKTRATALLTQCRDALGDLTVLETVEAFLAEGTGK